ncbi:PREDICTED: protein NRT1/ PTR FAMILY 4.3-like [Ipomoea nil]|uniref:protein NRT1/ PTR FAMILY 4.3-like n=1 Tax=Ipomoea nil TaxID=35883 RepID=UPI000901C4B2|nr:PREDICTED: protein NRT1/ PTR FAMILY 4.3-like [Ipomoea nil]
MDMEIGSSRGQDFKGEDDSNCPEQAVEETTLDWRGRPSDPAKHGGIRAAVFVLGLQGFEIMGIAAVGNNLITYVINEMHFSLSESANIVTNFIGTVFLLALLGGYLSDSFLGCFWTALIFAFLELSGFILLSVQAHLPQLKPPKCNVVVDGGDGCEEAKGLKALIFYVALYLVALGSGCVKPNMIAHGADQFDPQQNPKKLSTYFNAAYFAFSVGELVALTLLVWVQTHSGMDVGFGISAAAMAMGLISLLCGTVLYRNKPPQGSIFTPISQVFVAAFVKRKMEFPSDPRMLHGSHRTLSHHLHHTNRFRLLDKACIKQVEDGTSSKENPWRLCTVTQVEKVKVLISMIPIFACTIIFNTILAQLQTFSVQQGSAMNTNLNSFKIPPASLQAIPYMMLIFIVPLYDAVFVPFARKLTAHPSGISPLLRIGLGLFTATFSMVSAAVTENKRRTAAVKSGEILSIFWIAPQFLIFGFSEMLTAVGLIEFFYKQSTKGMQTFGTAMTYCSYSFGFYLSSVLVSMVNKITSSLSGSKRKGWLSDNNLNNDRLDLFYWLLAGMSFLNFLNYVFWARWFSRNRSSSSPEQQSFGTTKVVGDDSISVA